MLCVGWALAKLPAVFLCGVGVFQRSNEISVSFCGLLTGSFDYAKAMIQHWTSQAFYSASDQNYKRLMEGGLGVFCLKSCSRAIMVHNWSPGLCRGIWPVFGLPNNDVSFMAMPQSSIHWLHASGAFRCSQAVCNVY